MTFLSLIFCLNMKIENYDNYEKKYLLLLCLYIKYNLVLHIYYDYVCIYGIIYYFY